MNPNPNPKPKPHGHMKKIMWQPASTYDQLQYHAVMWSPIRTFPGSFPQTKSIRKLGRKVTNQGGKTPPISLPSLTHTLHLLSLASMHLHKWIHAPCTHAIAHMHPIIFSQHLCNHILTHIALSFSGLPVIVHMHAPYALFPDSQQLYAFCTLILQLTPHWELLTRTQIIL